MTDTPASIAADAAPEGWNWRTLLVIAALAVAVWWVWSRKTTKPEVPMVSNVTPAPTPPAGIPKTLAEKLAMAVDTQIPVVMTSGSAVPHDEDEINRIVASVLARVNALNESVTLINVVTASKTQDSYKTVSYDVVANVFDAKGHVGVMIVTNVLIPVSGTMFVRELRLYHAADKNDGPRPASEPAGHAPYESPLDVLNTTKI